MVTAVQILFNGNGGDVVRDVPAALERIADNLYGTRGNAEKLQAMIEADRADFGFLESQDLYPSLAHRLGRIARGDGRESLTVVVHDLDTPMSQETQVLHYDLVDPADPVAKLVDAVIAVAHDDTDVDEAADDLYSACQEAVRRETGFGNDPRRVLDTLRAYQDAFGYPAGHKLAVIPSEAEVAGRHKEVLADLPRRISSMFRDMGPSLVAPDESPAP